MMLTMMTMVLGVALAEDCPDASALSLEARQLLLQSKLEETVDLLAEARAGLACGPPPEAADLAEFWMTDGAYRFFGGGDERNGSLEVQAAGRIAPEQWDPALGEELKVVFFSSGEVTDTGQIILLGDIPRGYELRLNAEPTEATATVPAGYHHLGIVDRYGETRQDWMIAVPADGAIELRADPLPYQRSRKLLAASGGAALVAAGTAAGALIIGSRFDDIAAETQDVDKLDRAYRRQTVLGVTSYATMGLTATGLVLYFKL